MSDFIKLDKEYFGNKFTSDKLKSDYRKNLEKVARATIEDAKAIWGYEEQLKNIISGPDLVDNFWLAEPAKQEVFELASDKFKKLFPKKASELEERLTNKLKPLIREMLKKGR